MKNGGEYLRRNAFNTINFVLHYTAIRNAHVGRKKRLPFQKTSARPFLAQQSRDLFCSRKNDGINDGIFNKRRAFSNDCVKTHWAIEFPRAWKLSGVCTKRAAVELFTCLPTFSYPYKNLFRLYRRHACDRGLKETAHTKLCQKVI